MTQKEAAELKEGACSASFISMCTFVYVIGWLGVPLGENRDVKLSVVGKIVRAIASTI